MNIRLLNRVYLEWDGMNRLIQYSVTEFNDTYKDVLSEMIHMLYIEDPEGEIMDDDKIAATIKYAETHHDSLKIFLIMDEGGCSKPESSDKGQPIGYAIIQLIWSNEFCGITANIDEMYVVESARGQGIASEFIKNLHNLISGANRFTLEVTPSNDKALGLYERLGFEVAENRTMVKVIREVK